MKISPVTSSGPTIGAVGSESTQKIQPRSLRMNTNATPGRITEEIPAPAAVPQMTAGEPLGNPEKSKDEATEATQGNQPLSPQFAALAKQRRTLQVKEREISEKMKALEERELALKQGQGDTIQAAELDSDPLGVLLRRGIGFDKLAEIVSNYRPNQMPFDPRKLKEELLQTVREDVSKTLTESKSEMEKAEAEEYRMEAEYLMEQAAEKYEFVKEENAIPQVVEIINAYRKKGQMISTEQAMEQVEAWLENDFKRKLSSLKKLQEQVQPAQPAASPPQVQRQMKTLTNRDTASAPVSRRARALLAAQHGEAWRQKASINK